MPCKLRTSKLTLSTCICNKTCAEVMMKHAEGCCCEVAWECQLPTDHTKMRQKHKASKGNTVSINACPTVCTAATQSGCSSKSQCMQQQITMHAAANDSTCSSSSAVHVAANHSACSSKSQCMWQQLTVHVAASG